jgi:hypothetical protein
MGLRQNPQKFCHSPIGICGEPPKAFFDPARAVIPPPRLRAKGVAFSAPLHTAAGQAGIGRCGDSQGIKTLQNPATPPSNFCGHCVTVFRVPLLPNRSSRSFGLPTALGCHVALNLSRPEIREREISQVWSSSHLNNS